MTAITQMILGWIIGIAIVAPISYYFLRRQLKKHDRLLSENEAKNQAEFEEWCSKRWAGMTDEQRANEKFYNDQLRAMPIEESWKPRRGNSLSKDMLGFELLPK